NNENVVQQDIQFHSDMAAESEAKETVEEKGSRESDHEVMVLLKEQYLKNQEELAHHFIKKLLFAASQFSGLQSARRREKFCVFLYLEVVAVMMQHDRNGHSCRGFEFESFAQPNLVNLVELKMSRVNLHYLFTLFSGANECGIVVLEMKEDRNAS
ncbi:hypothetical protein L195_g037571, partial [Trifolium pratense]